MGVFLLIMKLINSRSVHDTEFRIRVAIKVMRDNFVYENNVY